MKMNDIYMLEKWGWINKNNFLWWNFDYPKEERKYFDNFEEFLKEFQTVCKVKGREIKVATSEYIPVSKLNLDIDDNKVNFMVTARPFTSRELEQYRSEWHGFQPFPKEDYANKDIETNEGCIGYLKEVISKEGFAFADHFLPHIRGIIKEVNEDSIFYHTMYNSWNGTKQNRDELIIRALEKSNLDFIFEKSTSGYGHHDVGDAIEKSLEYCKKKDLLHRVSNSMNYRIRKPIEIHKSFSQVTYDEINSNKSQFAYYPLLIEGHDEAIPFFICNNFFGEKGLFNLGVYSRDYFYPIKDKELLGKSSEELEKRLGEKVQPVYFSNIKGTMRPSKL
jgi:hypothetical protein